MDDYVGIRFFLSAQLADNVLAAAVLGADRDHSVLGVFKQFFSVILGYADWSRPIEI